jgi:hypothetical protein
MFVILKVNGTYTLISFLVYSSMSTRDSILQIASTFSLPLRSSCWHDGESPFSGPGIPRHAHPLMDLSLLHTCTEYLQVHSIETSTAKNYRTGARDYIQFCIKHSLPLNPTPQTLSHYISYTSQFITSGPKYLSGAHHFLCDLYPDFDDNRSSPLVQATIAGSRKIRADPVH